MHSHLNTFSSEKVSRIWIATAWFSQNPIDIVQISSVAKVSHFRLVIDED